MILYNFFLLGDVHFYFENGKLDDILSRFNGIKKNTDMIQIIKQLHFSIILFGAVFFFCTSTSYSQDLLVKMNGDTLEIEVKEIQELYLIYTKNSEDAERIFTTRRSRLDRIIYESGEVFIFSEEPFFDE